ncbi:MAG TPA: GNAT family protein [Herpetosiphonaceae bacterium]
MFHAAIEPDLLLRLFEHRHADELAAFFRDNRAHLTAELSWLAEPFSSADVQAYIQAGLDRFAANNGFRAGIWWRDQLAGCMSLHSVDWSDRKASFGYWLGAAFQGHGIITRSCQAVIAYAFTELELDRLEIQCATDNVRSRQVAQRLGFQQEGILRQSWRRQGQLVDQVVYGLLRSEWSPPATH